MESLKELEFIDKIEDNFPVENYLHCIKLIDEAIMISPNSVFAVVEEICKKAAEDVVHEETLVNLLKHIDKKFEHPLRKMILEIAQDIIFEDEISFETAAANMESVRQYKNQYAALNILFFSTEDVDGKLEKLWDNITTEWNDGQSLFDEDDEDENEEDEDEEPND
ncbi:MAG: hypothetical protein H0U95_18600 [Bacteroidetes bacterium]|nr:hypothetical protein [Bacteroidota bacterium]